MYIAITTTAFNMTMNITSTPLTITITTTAASTATTVTPIATTTAPTPLPPSTNNINYAVCDNDSEMCWALIGIGSVIVAILLIAVITCMIFTATVAKGTNALIQYFSNSATANGEYDIQPQQQKPQNQGKYIT